MTSRRRSTLSGIEPSSESSSLLECPVQPLSGFQTLLLTAHSTFKWAALFLTLALQRLVFPKGPLSAQRFSFFSLIIVTSSTSCPTNCFADDTCTITPGLPFITAQQKIQSDVTALATWARDHKLIIHPDKTVCMLFHHPRHHPPDLNIFLNNHAITQVHQHKHLGVILSSTLSWSPHVEHLISRSSAMLGLLRHLHSYFHFTSRCLLKVYLCYIRPLLEYGCSSFVGLSVRSARQLESVQQKASSICSVDSACIPSLSERRSSISLRLFFSILDDNVPDHLSGFCHYNNLFW